MRRTVRYLLALAAGLGCLGLLVWLTVEEPLRPQDVGAVLLFTALIVFATTFGVPLGGGEVSLQPMTTVAAYLVLGSVPTAWAVFASALVHGAIRQRWAHQLDARREATGLAVGAVASANATMHTISILVAGQVHLLAGGVTPLEPGNLKPVPLFSLGLTYLAVNFAIAGLYIRALGRAPLTVYLRSLPNLIVYEATPLLFAPLTALVYTQLGLDQFVLFAIALMIASLITRGLAYTQRRLERRIQELDSLQNVSRVLSASLDVDTTLMALYTGVGKLMPVGNFYVALYDAERDEVSFPLAIESGERVHWRSRRMGNGATEYVVRTAQSLLIPSGVSERLEQLGVDQIGRLAASWLGVPIVAGDEVLGAIAVQSYDAPGVYDEQHERILSTLAAQAAIAIQNARLYRRTDEALARRILELDSILRTTGEGILLTDLDWRVVAANRALAEFLGLAQLDLVDQMLDAPLPDRSASLLGRLSYSAAELEEDCATLSGQSGVRKRKVRLSGSSERHLEQTLAPVRDQRGDLVGWLFVFRDVTEEAELARLRDDMTRMLVHDLRSPLAILKGSLELIDEATELGQVERIARYLGMANRSSDRILSLIDALLDISRLESGQLPTQLEVLSAESLLHDTARQFAPLAEEARITVSVSAEPGLPAFRADRDLLVRVIGNLVDNAIKFTPDGGTVQLWAKTAQEAGLQWILMGVSDSGPGIPIEAQPRLFKKFQQVSSVRGRRRGSGLGLAFCRLVVEAHGGDIRVDSRPGAGSTFTVRLPLGTPQDLA